MLFSIVAVLIYIPINNVGEFPFSTPSPAFILHKFFDDGYFDQCEVILHCSFDLHFCKEIQPVHPKWDQSWAFIGRSDAEAETPILWPSNAKSWLIGKGSDAGRDWGQEEKGTTEDAMAGCHHRLDAHEIRWTPGVGDRQGALACCD